MKNDLGRVLLISAICFLIAGSTYRQPEPSLVTETVSRFKSDSKVLAQQINQLGKALDQIENDHPESLDRAKKALANSRIAYKRLEFLLEYFFTTSCRIYNRAPKSEVEEPTIEWQAPAGFQYIEQMLSDSQPAVYKNELQDQVKLLQLSADDLPSLMYKFPGTEAEILESARLQLVRVITLGITGFDAPSLKSGIQESRVALEAIQPIMSFYSKNQNPEKDSVDFYLNHSIKYLGQNQDFDAFDRMQFLTDCALPLQMHLGKMIKNLKLEVNKYGVLNYNANHLFSPNAFNAKSFQKNNRAVSESEIRLGKKLFFETKLSGNNRFSCASCHNPDKHFSDGLAKSIGFESNRFGKRNAPTLTYASLQHSQFWDGRVKTLEMQIENVIKDPTEMHGSSASIIKKLNVNQPYRTSFQNAFGKTKSGLIREKDIYKAIASYVRTLNPYNSRFDQYISGNKKALTDREISGFNLFMGKAQCATCHFAPLFNGLIPPTFVLTEFEILGTTGDDDFEKPAADPDEGRFGLYPVSFYKNAFKTPTVRNSAATGPYMHNGAFKTLESVIEFYDRGGGAGLGLDIPNQTLSSAKLNLTQQEKKDLVAFLESLTDKLEK